MVPTVTNNNMQILWDDGERVLCRGRRLGEDGEREVLIARPSAEQPLPASLERLAHEFSLRDELDEAWALRPQALVREAGRLLLVHDDPGGELLAGMLDRPMQTELFLTLAISIVTVLGRFHQRGLIHKDIKPSHLLVNCADGQARLCGFGLASRLPRERQAPETLAGTLAYMAPEQTGRMNRSIDSRSDLYALGVTFYQMLTGVLPFTATEPMEWVHGHIAKQPRPPHTRLASIPETLSRIVLKLLAKTAEERYQTAAGLEHDLRRCLADWQQQGQIDDFPLDLQGAHDRLLIAEKLYGREHEVETLVAAFQRIVASRAPEWLLVRGYSGIGKSSVVNELHRVLVPSRGLFASGKFDQYQRDIPYATLVQAFQGLVRTLLGKRESDLASWRDRLLAAVGANGRLLTDLIPELKLIIGEPPDVPELEPQQAKHRFGQVFQGFIGVFARAEHPLVLFLDDLQWLDAATLELLEHLLTSAQLRHLLLIGAYRDNEVNAAHPLLVKVQSLKEAGVRINDIHLAPLALGHIEQLISEALQGEQLNISLLAQLVLDKTGGNPFFVVQFLQALADEHLLTFDYQARQWRWDPRRIEAKGYTDNVVDLMVNKLARLPDSTQQALQQLACLGNVAHISRLSTVLGQPEAQVHARLWEAVRQELVERREDTYGFVHDRIHEAAYSLIPEPLRAAVHLRIGRLLARQTPAHPLEEVIFEIVGQLNRGATLITDHSEREQLARFNLLAGQRAKASTAYASALSYFTVGAGLLSEDDWAHRHPLMFALASGQARCEFLTGQLAVAEARLATLAHRAVSIVERALVACLQMDVYLILDQSESAVTVCLAFLNHVDIQWSPHPDLATLSTEYARIGAQLGDRVIDTLIDLPPMENPEALATVEALTKLFAPALQTDANLACLTVCKAISLSLEYGNCDASCVAYANIARISGRYFGDYPSGFRFGQLGFELVERRGLKRFEGRTLLCFANFAERWINPVRDCHVLLRRAFTAAHNSGDLPFAAFACDSLASNMLFVGEPLAELQNEAERGLAYAQSVRFALVIDFMQIQLAVIRMLRGLTPVFGCFDNEQFSETDTEQHLAKPSLVQAACWYGLRKLQACYLAGDYAAALDAAGQAQQLLWTSDSFLEEAEYHFYSALALAGCCDGAPADERARHLDAMAAHHHRLQRWAQPCAANFSSRVALVGAEIARVEGRTLDAERLYEQAIECAQQSAFVHIEALANERAALFYAERGLGKIARVYLQDARYGYRRWGADGKVRHLEEQHPLLRMEAHLPGATATITTPVEHLDLVTVLKVSQAVSGEIVLEKLIDNVMRTALEQAGAARGLLVLSNGGEQRIVAEVTTDDRATQLQLRDAPVTATLLPESVLNHVLRSGESVVLDDALSLSAFSDDPYLRQHPVRSVLCLPLTNQARLTGALYLENNLAARVFSPSRIAVLKLVASQAAISLENARLYRDVAQREAKIRRLVEANIIGIVFWNADSEIIEANDAFLRLVGYTREELAVGRIRWRDLTPPELHAESEQARSETLRTGRAQPFEKEYIHKDGRRVPIIVGLATFEASRHEGVAFVLDLTERKQSEARVRDSERRYREVQAELAHANRVATMGQLAASIGHEVSQPIAAAVLNAHAALRWLNAQPPEVEEVRQVLGSLIRDANRAADVLGRIRGHIRKAPPLKEPMDINTAIREMVEFTRGQVFESGASVHLQLADGLPLIDGDRVELQQVLLNLILNGLEAMSTVTDGVRQLHISAAQEQGGGVLVQVSDSGPGFAAEHAEQVFAAFYTTKPTGLGMGLSICRSIIEALGGRLWASANQPRGAIMQFSLPGNGQS